MGASWGLFIHMRFTYIHRHIYIWGLHIHIYTYLYSYMFVHFITHCFVKCIHPSNNIPSLISVCATPSTRIKAKPFQLVMWFIFNLKRNKVTGIWTVHYHKLSNIYIHLEQVRTRVPHLQAHDSNKPSHVSWCVPTRFGLREDGLSSQGANPNIQI